MLCCISVLLIPCGLFTAYMHASSDCMPFFRCRFPMVAIVDHTCIKLQWALVVFIESQCDRVKEGQD